MEDEEKNEGATVAIPIELVQQANRKLDKLNQATDDITLAYVMAVEAGEPAERIHFLDVSMQIHEASYRSFLNALIVLGLKPEVEGL